MKWYSNYKHPEGKRFIIEDMDESGFYLFVYEDDESFEHDIADPGFSSQHFEDHDQDTLEMAKLHAHEEFGVPLDSWVEVSEEGANS